MRGRSVRFRITALATLITAVVFTVLAVVVTAMVHRQLLDNLDRSLAQRADQVEAVSLADPVVALANENDEDRFAQVIDDAGAVLFATDNLDGQPPVVAAPDVHEGASTHTDIPIEDDVYRVVVRRFEVDGRTRYVVAGENIDDVQDGERSLAGTLAMALPVALAVLALATWWLVGRALRPVERMRQEVASVGLHELDRRLPAPGTGDEIDRLATTMNSMLARLDEAVTREQRFVADASHELRSPLTRMRSTIEVDLAHPDADLRATAHSALADVEAMQHLVDDLLLLARHDAGQAPARLVPVDLDAVVDEEARSLRSRATTLGVSIDMSAVSAATVHADRAALAQLVRNILANAVRHARTKIAVTTAEVDGRATFSVDDDGPGISPADRTRIFDRFVRLDNARTSENGRTGLGLAIVAEIAARHNATVEVNDSPTGGARVTVTFPAQT